MILSDAYQARYGESPQKNWARFEGFVLIGNSDHLLRIINAYIIHT